MRRKTKAKPKQKITVKFCPKCQSTQLIPLAGGQIGIFQCQNCKFSGSIFPEKQIDVDKLEKEK